MELQKGLASQFEITLQTRLEMVLGYPGLVIERVVGLVVGLEMVIHKELAMGLEIALETGNDTANEARVLSDIGKGLS